MSDGTNESTKLDAPGPNESPKQRDSWDKADIVAKICSSVLIATIGLIVTFKFNHAQEIASQSQIDLLRQKQAAEYIEKIESTSDTTVRASLMKALDIMTDPSTAVRIAFQYAYPNRNGDNPMPDAAVGVLKREKAIGHKALLDIIKNEDIHDVDEFNQEEMANAIVTDKNDRLFLRVSEIDDLVEVNLNGQRIDDNKWMVPILDGSI